MWEEAAIFASFCTKEASVLGSVLHLSITQLTFAVPEKYHRLINDPESRVTEVFMEKKPVKGVVIQEPPQPAAATGQHIVQASRDSSARPHNTPSTSTVTQVSSQRTEEKSSLSLSQQTTEQLHLVSLLLIMIEVFSILSSINVYFETVQIVLEL